MPSDDPMNPDGVDSEQPAQDSFGQDIQQPPSNLLRETVKVVDGRCTVISTEDYVKGTDGYTKRQTKEFYQLAADGRELPVSEFVAISWTGLPIPRDRYVGPCHDPFKRHENEIRPVYDKVDGIVTYLGGVFCGHCLKFYEDLLKLEEKSRGTLYKAPQL